MIDFEGDIFLNCPFDSQYKSLFEAIVFTVTASGYRVRCALEEDDGSDIRFSKLCRLIEKSPRSIHDLSRVELNDDSLPRFNMPFELGLYIGSKQFGGPKHRNKTALIMVREPYSMPSYLSDLGGNDPRAHHNRLEEVIRLVRGYLSVRPGGAPLPGAGTLAERLQDFKMEVPQIAASLKIKASELDIFQEYRDYVYVLAAFLKAKPVL